MRYSGQELSIGTGFVVEQDGTPFLITNRHNVTGRHQETNELLSGKGAVPDEILIRHCKKNNLGQWLGKVEPLFKDEKQLWIEHLYLKEKADFVAIELTKIDGIEINPYSLIAKEIDITVGPAEAVSVIGFPFGSSVEGFAIWATGFIATEMDMNYNKLPVVLIDCRTRQGQSGSPVIAFRSAGSINTNKGMAISEGPMTRLLGIYSGRINKDSDLGMMWKVSAIRELMASLRPPVLGEKISYSFQLK